ncbi:myosin heavy chain non-muscle [Anaeramoeba flamelloides]|uniref:Myosin heavy chain non-muscle n=1 Tax=Anaeramoeba flamelloides TaxID=1746091 RepID=A0AAV7YAN3_9EUKA|nr:myosin heavy chain non-muscle [Anaeramoeba flamelloides]
MTTEITNYKSGRKNTNRKLFKTSGSSNKEVRTLYRSKAINIRAKDNTTKSKTPNTNPNPNSNPNPKPKTNPKTKTKTKTKIKKKNPKTKTKTKTNTKKKFSQEQKQKKETSREGNTHGLNNEEIQNEIEHKNSEIEKELRQIEKLTSSQLQIKKLKNLIIKKVNSFENQIEDKDTELEILTETIEDYDTEKEKTKERIEKLRGERNELAEMFQSAETLVKNKNKKIEETKKEIVDLKEKYLKQKEELKKQISDNKELIEKGTKLNEQNENYEKSNNELQKIEKELILKNKEQENIILNLKKEIETQKSELINTSQTEISKIESQYQIKEKEIERKLNNCELQFNEKLIQEKQLFEKKIEELKLNNGSLLKEKDLEIEKKKETIQELQKEIENFKKEKELCEQKMQKLELEKESEREREREREKEQEEENGKEMGKGKEEIKTESNEGNNFESYQNYLNNEGDNYKSNELSTLKKKLLNFKKTNLQFKLRIKKNENLFKQMKQKFETDLANKEDELKEKNNSFTKIEKLNIKLEKKIQLNKKSNLEFLKKQEELELKQKENESYISQLKDSNNKLSEKIDLLTNEIKNKTKQSVNSINNNDDINKTSQSDNFNNNVDIGSGNDNDDVDDNDNDNDKKKNIEAIEEIQLSGNNNKEFNSIDISEYDEIIILKIQKLLKTYTQKNKYKMAFKQRNILDSISKSEIEYLSQMNFFVKEYLKPIQELNVMDDKLISHLLKILEKMTSLSSSFTQDLANIIQNYNTSSQFKSKDEESKEKTIYGNFIDYSNEMIVYISYYKDITKFNSILKVKLSEEDTIKQFILNKKKRFPTELNLFEFVIIPIRRLTVYYQFFRDLSKTINKSNIDYHNIQNSLLRIRKYKSTIKKIKK